MKIAVDLGFGRIKVASEYGDCKAFPTYIKPRKDSRFCFLGSKNVDYEVSIIDASGNEIKRHVGDAACTFGADRKWDDKGAELNEEDLKIYVATAVSLVNHNSDPVDLCLGLPISHYTADRKETIRNLLKNLKMDIVVNNKKHHIHINKVRIYVQGMGAYYASVMDIDGNMINNGTPTSNVALIDVGYRTVDYVVMVKGPEGIVLSDELSGSMDEGGMHAAYSAIRQAQTEEISLVEYEKAILWADGKLDCADGKIDLSATATEKYREHAQKIASHLKLTWSQAYKTLTKIIITGGGGEALYPYLAQMIPNAELQAEPVYANCRGYLALDAMLQHRR